MTVWNSTESRIPTNLTIVCTQLKKFMGSDQVKFIEDINNILNVGELNSLFANEDEEEIHYEIEK